MTETEIKAINIETKKKQLKRLDERSTRAIREIILSVDTVAATQVLQSIQNEITTVRAEMQVLCDSC